MPADPSPAPQSSIILYQTEDGGTRIDVRFQDQTLWLSLNQLAELFQATKQNISLHIQNIFREGELAPGATVKEYLTVQSEGQRRVGRHIQYYNLPLILAVGFRVHTLRGTQFRQWAAARLQEYLVHGFVLDDERLKNPPGKGQRDYFDDLLERIRDIRSSERRFYQKVLDIYATSIDYTPNADVSQEFFATVQNKMHWASHGHTAAEVIHERADATKPLMGLKSTRPGNIVRKDDVSIAKNYLDEVELNVLNRIVTAYLEFAEVQALNRRPMTMRDWIVKLDDFLRLTGRELLHNAGTISADDAKAKAELEYDRYKRRMDALPRPVDADFERVTGKLKKLPKPKKYRKGDVR